MVAEAQGTRTHWFSKHMLLQSMISLKPEIQMKNREIPILDNNNIFPMRYGRSSNIFTTVVHDTFLKLLYMRSHCVHT